jgi:hypothetical protein
MMLRYYYWIFPIWNKLWYTVKLNCLLKSYSMQVMLYQLIRWLPTSFQTEFSYILLVNNKWRAFNSNLIFFKSLNGLLYWLVFIFISTLDAQVYYFQINVDERYDYLMCYLVVLHEFLLCPIEPGPFRHLASLRLDHI